jgi:glycerophosphoryl diester phosphodiesterase
MRQSVANCPIERQSALAATFNWGLLLMFVSHAAAGSPITIAHRGASAYLPEHTLEAKALAIGLGADFVEQDIVMTKDDVPIVNHDIFLEDVTNIAAQFPGRARSDGHHYAIDFTLAELKTLTRHERVHDDGTLVFKTRFPRTASRFAIVTLAEEIEFVQGLNRSMGKNVGLYTEVKFPAWHRDHGKDITRAVLDTLARYGYRSRRDNAYFQCFDAMELKRVRSDLQSDLKLVQLIGENAWHESTSDYDAMRTEAGIAGVAAYADGIGPEITQVLQWSESGNSAVDTGLTRRAHLNGLTVHPYTLRLDQLPPHASSADAVLDALFNLIKVDGVFTDFTDIVVAYLGAHPASGLQKSESKK